jgi:hypothetical protein
MDPQLPDDLANLQRQLTSQSQLEPGAGLRDRVLAAVGRELRRPPETAPGMGDWRFVAALAAAVLLWANLSMSVTLDSSGGRPGAPEPGRLDAAVAEARRLLPELSEREAYRQAVLARAGTRLTPMPNPRPTLAGLLSAGDTK